MNSGNSSQANLVRIVYVLHLVGLITGGLTALIGAIIAHVNAGQAISPYREHYRFQYRTFWIGVLYNLIAGITTVALVGWVLLVIIAVWWIVRCARGLSALEKQMPPAKLETWGF
ncbi:hypothetical protein A11A3_04159 [Alcanivorax hongdengensis A-11-3]|uniref:Transmembrane protein n=1 Tax=Alcanivorax hongdengensis A-11-3 TaxID=1177179 RepID=L0WHB7_9GAMM|nr:hypothetical protein [Alcanivorax hongdengensis]EKF75522.1 hypothetical protein A11A3_04159 [Alcanivorax hongdengensis A-11-3]